MMSVEKAKEIVEAFKLIIRPSAKEMADFKQAIQILASIRMPE